MKVASTIWMGNHDLAQGLYIYFICANICPQPQGIWKHSTTLLCAKRKPQVATSKCLAKKICLDIWRGVDLYYNMQQVGNVLSSSS